MHSSSGLSQIRHLKVQAQNVRTVTYTIVVVVVDITVVIVVLLPTVRTVGCLKYQCCCYYCCCCDGLYTCYYIFLIYCILIVSCLLTFTCVYLLYLPTAPISRLVKKLSQGAMIVAETATTAVVAPLSRTTSPASLQHSASTSTLTGTVVGQTGESEEYTPTLSERPSLTAELSLRSLGRGSIMSVDGFLDLTETAMEAVAPPPPSEEDTRDSQAPINYVRDALEQEEKLQPSASPASRGVLKRSVSAQRAKRGLSRSHGTKLNTNDSTPIPPPPPTGAIGGGGGNNTTPSLSHTGNVKVVPRSEVASIRALKATPLSESQRDPEPRGYEEEEGEYYEEKSSYYVPAQDDAAAGVDMGAMSPVVADNALNRAATRRKSRQDCSSVSPATTPNASPLRYNKSGYQPKGEQPSPPPASAENALTKASIRRKSRTLERTALLPQQSTGDAAPPPPPPPPSTAAATGVLVKPPPPPPPPDAYSAPPPPPEEYTAQPPPPGECTASSTVTSPQSINSPGTSTSVPKIKIATSHSMDEEEEVEKRSSSVSATAVDPKWLRAKRMKSLYVAVSQRSMRLTDTDVTPYGKIKKCKKREEYADKDYEHFRASSSVYDTDGEDEHVRESEVTQYYPTDTIRGIGGVCQASSSNEDYPTTTAASAQLQYDDEEDAMFPTQTNTVSWGGGGGSTDGRVSPPINTTFVPVPTSRSSSRLSALEQQEEGDGYQRDYSPTTDQNPTERVYERDYDNETIDSHSTTSTSYLASQNALERSAQRRRSRSASPSAIAIRRASKRMSKMDAQQGQRATSAGATLQRNSSNSSFLDFFNGSSHSSKVKYIEEAGVLTALDLLQENSRQPLVRRLFENYCKADQTLDITLVQQLCYDIGIYYSHMDIKISIKPFLHSSQNGIMDYDAFMVWWRSNNDFRCDF